MTQLQQYVYVICVLEEVLKLHHVLMLDRAVNLDLTHELLLGSALCERGLKDDFGRIDLPRLLTSKFVALRKAALAQKLTLDVAPHRGLARRLHDPLLDDRRDRGGLRVGD